MIKDALEYLVRLGNTRMEHDGERLLSTQPLHPVLEAVPVTLEIRSLRGLVSYIQSHFDGDESWMIHVESPRDVVVLSPCNRDRKRREWMRAKAMTPEFPFGQFLDVESFLIRLQSNVVDAYDRNVILKVVGNLRDEDITTYGDDGVSQQVTAKTGVATVAKVRVPNPVVLAPYRTFAEVEQPMSSFVFRMQQGPKCGLFEADGGAWRLAAMEAIGAYLQDRLRAEMDAKRVVLLA